jgi:hypothetical protein
VMRRLYDVGNETARKGPVWVTRPPGFLFDVAP